ncbi:hypothetical protein ACS0TY_032579 [Phlomoides rotata]
MKGTTPGSDMVQVEGGHIIRSTSRKDRHSKVYTSKGPRDRRVRLAAHTAIQFYDVQDRLGYDRPSKAVDWLINKARTAIDNLTPAPDPNPSSKISHPDCTSFLVGASEDHQPDSHFVKSFFPAANFPGFSGEDSVSRAASFHGEDLGLSLQSFQQEGFQRIEGWNNMDSRVGFADQGMLLQSNLGVNPWNTLDHEHNSSKSSSDFQSLFEVGFRVPTRIYGEEEPINHR